MSKDFDARNKAEWAASIRKAFGDSPPRSANWSAPQDMIDVLSPFMGANLNHTMMPTSGGLDMSSIANSAEPGCLELIVTKRMVETFRPGTLYFEHFPESPWNSFFLLEAQPLKPCGVYEDNNGESEEVVELAPGEYIERHHGDSGILGHDEDGVEIPLPETFRCVSRHLTGKFLIVAKRSIWNLNKATYDGRHSHMTAAEIREQIQHVIGDA